MMTDKPNSHGEIELLLAQKNALWPDELHRVEQHLKSCEQCRSYAVFLEEIDGQSWSPYPAEELTPQQKQEVLNMIELKQAKLPKPMQINLNRVGRVLASMSALFLIGLLSVLIFRSDSSSKPDPLASVNPAGKDYDGWEMGVAYDIPKEWDYQSFILLNGNYTLGNVMGLSNHPVNEEKLFSPWKLEAGESRAMISVKNPIFDLSGDPIVHMQEFSTYFNGPAGPYEVVEFSGRQTYLLQSAYSGRDFIDATFFVDNRLVRIYIEGKADVEGTMPDIKGMAEFVAASMVRVTYDDWDIWQNPEVDLTLTLPPNRAISTDVPDQSLRIHEKNGDTEEDWLIWYGDPSASEDMSEDEIKQVFEAYFDDPQYDILSNSYLGTVFPTAKIIEHLSNQLADSNQRMILYEKGDGGYLLTAAMPNYSLNYNLPLIVMTLEFDRSELGEMQPVFNQVLRSMRNTAVPILPPAEPIQDLNYRQASSSNYSIPRSHKGAEMVTDFKDISLVVDSINQTESETQVDFFMVAPVEDGYFMAEAIEGRLVDGSGRELPYKSGIFYSMNGGTEVNYNPPSSAKYVGRLDQSASEEIAIYTDVILYFVPATKQIGVNLSDRNWGERWVVNEKIYFNGASVTFTEAWLDGETDTLKMTGVLLAENSLYGIDNLYHTQNSDAKLMLDGERVELTYELADQPLRELGLYLEATIQYDDALSTKFSVNDDGTINNLEN